MPVENGLNGLPPRLVVASLRRGEHGVVERDDGPRVRVVRKHPVEPNRLLGVHAVGIERDQPDALVVHRVARLFQPRHPVLRQRELRPPVLRKPPGRVFVVPGGRHARDGTVRPAARLVPLGPFQVGIGAVDEVARMQIEAGRRGVAECAPDYAGPVHLDVVLGVAEVNETEGLVPVGGGGELLPCRPLGSRPNAINVRRLGVEAAKHGRMVTRVADLGSQHLGLGGERPSLGGKAGTILGDGDLDALRGGGGAGPPRDGLARRGVGGPRQHDAIGEFGGPVLLDQFGVWSSRLHGRLVGKDRRHDEQRERQANQPHAV